MAKLAKPTELKTARCAQWLAVLIKTRFPFKPAILQDQIRNLEPYPGQVTVYSTNELVYPVYKLVLPLPSKTDYRPILARILEHITDMEARTASWLDTSEPADWLEEDK